MKRILIVILVILILTAVWVAFRIYNKPHRDSLTEAAIPITAVELFRSYEDNEEVANALYLDKVLEITGEISEITTNQEKMPIVAFETENPMFGIRCTMDNPSINVQPGDSVTIRGICSGYLSDVIIIKSVITEQKK